MIKINQLKLPVGHSQKDLEDKIRKTLRIPSKETFHYEVMRRSLDARKKPSLFYVYCIYVTIRQENSIVKKLHQPSVSLVTETGYRFSEMGHERLNRRPVIVGAGPCGLFAAWQLTLAGYAPLILERGKQVEDRSADVERFWETGILQPDSNVQFGEGGAGTFSDGKLNTLVKDPIGRNRFVLETFVKFGAPEHILYENKPHIGTDILADVIKRMREFMTENGVEFLFETCVTGFSTGKNGNLKSIELNHDRQIDTDCLILAIGHSARDTFSLLQEKGLNMQAKSFAVGFRVEHPQSMINHAQYGDADMRYLPTAPYKLTAQTPVGRGVYSFCMCPGGYVVNASSEPGRLAVNGMSYQARDSRNANSAMIVTVTPEDFPDKGVLGGVEFQRDLEKKAWELGEGKIPVQLFGDFCKNQASEALGEVTPCMKGEYILTNVRSVLPKAVGDSIEEGVIAFGKRISGFDREDALLSGIESRTSSPVRIVRDQKLTANMAGIYPCGEGAGYAGGITSAAMDGIKVAETVCRKYAAIKNN